jgi:hypothetical protein
VIKESATDSKSWWPPRMVPPKGAQVPSTGATRMP